MNFYSQKSVFFQVFHPDGGDGEHDMNLQGRRVGAAERDWNVAGKRWGISKNVTKLQVFFGVAHNFVDQ